MADLSTVFADLQLKNPVIIGSSGLSDSTKNIISLEEKGAAAVVLKSLFEEEILSEMNASMNRMNAEDFLYPETVDYYDFYEGPEENTIRYIRQIENAKRSVSIPVIGSINCLSPAQWTYFPKEIEKAGANALELNIFVLPSDLNRSAGENEKVYFEIIQEVLKQVHIPVIVKLSHYFSNLASFLKNVSKTGIKGLVLFNRFYNPDINTETFELTSDAVLSSPSDMYLPLRWIGIMAGRVDCSLAASTGVHDGMGVIKQILAGADAVEIASAIYKYGHDHIRVMLNDLETWMDKKGFQTIDQFKGRVSQSRSINPAAFERVQFMKYFRGFSNKV